jgi:hypothetical protein
MKKGIVNQSEWQSLAILVAALAFVLAATAIQWLLARMATRRGTAEPPSVPQVPARSPVEAPSGSDIPGSEETRSDRRAPDRRVSVPTSTAPTPAARRRARRFLRGPGELRAAILAREILGPAKGLAGSPSQR